MSKIFNIVLAGITFFSTLCLGKIEKKDAAFLEDMAKSVLEASTRDGVVYPCAKGGYPAFWIREHALALGIDMTPMEIRRNLLILTAQTQADKTWITQGGSIVPIGSIADHIIMEGKKPIYFPGTYSYEKQGMEQWGTLPPLDDQFYFVKMAYDYVKALKSDAVLKEEINGKTFIDRLELAFNSVPSEDDIPVCTDNYYGADFGYKDTVKTTGRLLFTALLKREAAIDMSEMFSMLGDGKKAAAYAEIAKRIKKSIPELFFDKNKNLLRASTGMSNQLDVFASAYAVATGAVDGETAAKISEALKRLYLDGKISMRGMIRNVPVGDDFSENSIWEKTCAPYGIYQNGAFWNIATGWVCEAIALTDPASAEKLMKEYIDNLRANDYRNGGAEPSEWFSKDGKIGVPKYLASVTCPLESLRKLKRKFGIE